MKPGYKNPAVILKKLPAPLPKNVPEKISFLRGVLRNTTLTSTCHWKKPNHHTSLRDHLGPGLLGDDDGSVQTAGTGRAAVQLPVVAEVLRFAFDNLQILAGGRGLRIPVLVNK